MSQTHLLHIQFRDFMTWLGYTRFHPSVWPLCVRVHHGVGLCCDFSVDTRVESPAVWYWDLRALAAHWEGLFFQYETLTTTLETKVLMCIFVVHICNQTSTARCHSTLERAGAAGKGATTNQNTTVHVQSIRLSCNMSVCFAFRPMNEHTGK